jgi:hypothetical protein
MNLSIRMRVGIAAGVVVAAGLAGCQTTRDYIDDRFPQVDLPRPSMPSFDSMVPFRKSKTPTYAEPYDPPKLEAVPDSEGPLILPAPASTNSPSRARSRAVSAPPALPPFEPETAVPSAGLFPSGPVRRMGFETSSVIKDSNIIQTGCCAPIVQSCCPPPCCPTPCCETSCCPTGCGMSALLGTVAQPYYVAKYGIQNVKDRLRCKLSALGSCCSPCASSCCAPCAPSCGPCVSSCDPCGSCVTNEYVMEGVVVNQYPLNGGCSTCSTGMNSVPQIPMHYQAAPQDPWRQPAQQFRRPQAPCGCQNQQAAQYPPNQHPPQPQYSPQQAYQPQPQYQQARPAYPQPQVAVRPPQYQPTYRPNPVQQQPQQQVAQPYQYRPQPAQQPPVQAQPQFNNQNAQAPVAQPQQNYSDPQPVEPAMPQEPTANTEEPQPAPQTSSLTPGHSPLGGQSSGSRTARVYRATRFQ